MSPRFLVSLETLEEVRPYFELCIFVTMSLLKRIHINNYLRLLPHIRLVLRIESQPVAAVLLAS